MSRRWKHGGYAGGKENATHYIWRSMHARCTNPNRRDYPHYGLRGISVCHEWRSYSNFLADMGERPYGLSLERKDNGLGYTKANCMWATRSQQQSNKTSTRWYRRQSDNFTGTLVQAAAELRVSKELAWWRWKNWGTFMKGQVWRELQKGL